MALSSVEPVAVQDTARGMEMSAEPSKAALPAPSPDMEMVRGVDSTSAEPALPETLACRGWLWSPRLYSSAVPALPELGGMGVASEGVCLVSILSTRVSMPLRKSSVCFSKLGPERGPCHSGLYLNIYVPSFRAR